MPDTTKTLGTKEVIAKNTLLNFVVQLLLIPLAVVSIPILIGRLGNEAFGILSIVWVFIGYFALLDFGIGKTVTKYVAEAIARDEKQRAWRIVWVSFFVSILIGIILLVAVGFSSNFLAHKLFTGKTLNYDQVKNGILIAAIALPFILAQGILRAHLMALQRFDFTNLVQVLSGAAQWVGSIIIVKLGFGLNEILSFTVMLRAVNVAILLFVVGSASKGFFKELAFFDSGIVKGLAGYSSWIALSQIVSPVLVYSDRFFLSSYVSTAKATFFIVPFEMLSRFLIIPMALSPTLFPALTERRALNAAGESLNLLYYRSMKYIFLVMLPLAVLAFSFASDILRIWVGDRFVYESSVAFRFLAIGFLLNSIAFVPSTALQAIGRPDTVAMLQVLELPLYLLYCFLVIPTFGINGAAIGNTFRMGIDMALLLLLARRELKVSSSAWNLSSLVRLTVPATLLLGGVFSVKLFMSFNMLEIAAILFVLIIYSATVYFFTFDKRERDFLSRSVNRALNFASKRND